MFCVLPTYQGTYTINRENVAETTYRDICYYPTLIPYFTNSAKFCQAKIKFSLLYQVLSKFFVELMIYT